MYKEYRDTYHRAVKDTAEGQPIDHNDAVTLLDYCTELRKALTAAVPFLGAFNEIHFPDGESCQAYISLTNQAENLVLDLLTSPRGYVSLSVVVPRRTIAGWPVC